MKRVITLVLVLMFCIAALADSNWSSYTDEELQAMVDELSVIIKEARAEQISRKTNTDGKVVIFDQDGHKLTLESMTNGDSIFAKSSIDFTVVYENNSNGNTILAIANCYVNGWEVGSLGSFDTKVGYKEKETLNIKLDETDVSSLDDVENIEFQYQYIDDHYSILKNFKPVLVYSK